MDLCIQEDFFDIILNEIKAGKVSHAYLIETNNFRQVDEVLNIFVKLLLCPNNLVKDGCSECQICSLIQTNAYPDLKIVDTDNAWIKKEQLLDVKEQFLSKSIYGGKQIYVIKDATKLNLSSGNTMLKFLEEPSPNIVAILLANNRYNVLDTIRSRCQIFSLRNDEVIEFDDEIFDLMKSLFIENNGFLAYQNILAIIPDKKKAIECFSSIEQYLFQVINKKVDVVSFLDFLSYDMILKIIAILEDYLKKMEYNLNYKLMLDNLILDIGEVI